MPRSLVICAACRQARPVEGRGLCSPCYQWHRRRGLLDQFQRVLHQSPDEWFAEIDQGDSETCWPWPGSKNEDGYGIIWVNPRMHPAHRVAYERFVGPIPPGMTLDHMCHDSDICTLGVNCPHRACVNPSHLQPATHLDNARRSLADRAACDRGHEQSAENIYRRDGRTWCRLCRLDSARTNDKTRRVDAGLRVHQDGDHCINGHTFTAENTYRHPETGYRECYTCRRNNYRRYYARKKARSTTG